MIHYNKSTIWKYRNKTEHDLSQRNFTAIWVNRYFCILQCTLCYM